MPRILVADDNTNIQRMVSLAFSPRGIEVVAVGNGEAAVRRLPEFNPDLVLADIFMPVRNGYEVCEYVKKDERFSHIPVILLVGAFDPLDEKEARRVGADGVLKKPFVPPDPLIAMVIAVLEKNPRIAAELAKPKETPVAAAGPVVTEHALPPKVAPKPLPSFPEPSPAEAALVYGFGSGRRTLDNDEKSASLALKDPLAETSNEDTEEGSGASKDWRQSARDFEVPEEAVNMPAFASDENFSAPMRPTTQDTVSLPEPEPVACAPAAVPTLAAPTMATQVEEQSASAIEEPKSAEPSAEKVDAPPSSRFGSKTAHWTEMMGSLSEYKKGGWFAAATAAVEESVKGEPEPAISESVAASAPSDEPETAMNAGTNPTNLERAEEIPELATHAVMDSTPVPATEEKAAIDFDTFKAASAWPNPALQETESAVVIPDVAQPSTDDLPVDSFFNADVKDYERSETSEQESSATPSAFAVEEERIEKELEPILADSPTISAEFGLDASLLAASANGITNTTFRDPNLVMPPAVRVTPEPLLIDDEPAAASSAYGLKTQETTPLHSFDMPVQNETAPIETSGVEGAPDREEKEDPGFELRQTEIKAWGAIPRPTGRELVAHIPYLAPPPDINETPDPAVEATPGIAAAAPSNGTAIDPSMVDAIAQRVLEALEPKLYELLSRGLLKPLVENILHDELTKKDK